jgi:hypothetical protein
LLAGVFLVVIGTVWIARAYQTMRDHPRHQFVPVVSTGMMWVIFGLGVASISLSDGRGHWSTIGVAALAAGVGLRVAVALAFSSRPRG